MASDRESAIRRVSLLTIFLNIALSIIKLSAGFFARSSAIISDGVNSLTDVFSTLGVMVGVHLGGRKDDQDHNYGHEKFESIAAVLLGSFLAVVAIGIGISGVNNISLALRGELPVPGWWAAVAAVISIVTKEWMYRYSIKAALTTQSTALKADAWNHRGDALSSIGSLVGVVGARLGLPLLDPVAAMLIALLILKVAFDVLREAASQLTDKAADDQTCCRIEEIIAHTPGVKNVDELKTRLHANRLYIDAEIAVDGDLSLRQAHDIAQTVHNRVEEAFSQVKHIMVHVNPYEQKSAEKG